MNKWKRRAFIVFAIAFVLLAFDGFLFVLDSYSPVEDVAEFSPAPNTRIWIESVSVEIEPHFIVLVFVFSVVLIAFGSVCRAKGSQASKTNSLSHEEQSK